MIFRGKTSSLKAMQRDLKMYGFNKIRENDGEGGSAYRKWRGALKGQGGRLEALLVFTRELRNVENGGRS